MTAPQATSLSPRAKSLVRLLVMVELSLALHLAIIFGIQIGAVEQGSQAHQAIEARLMPAPSATAREAIAQEILVKASVRPTRLLTEDVQPPADSVPSDSPKSQPEQPKPGISEAAASPTLVDAPLPPDGNYYPAREVDDHPVVVSRSIPVYPAKAAEANIKGSVSVLFLLNENGRVDEVTVLDETPSGLGFDAAVHEWLKQARFKPAMRKGRAVKSRVVFRVTFDPNN